MQVERDRNRLTQKQIDELIAEAALKKKHDDHEAYAATAKVKVEDNLQKSESKLNKGVREKLSSEQRDTVDKAIAEIRSLKASVGEVQETIPDPMATAADSPNIPNPRYIPQFIPDPDATMPEGWNEDAEPGKITDPDAKMPDDWNDDEDGEWEAPLIDNPECAIGCGKWEPPKIRNPEHPSAKIDSLQKSINEILDNFPESDTASDADDEDFDDVESDADEADEL